MNKWQRQDSEHIWHPFSPLAGTPPFLVKKAKGLSLFTQDGREILDMISSWWVNIHGHANPKIAKAISRQSKKLEQVIFAGFTHKPAIKLAKKLKSILPKEQAKVFFSDDGSTAVEVALKLSLQYWHNQGKPRMRMIAIEGAYHGDTFGAMSVGGRGIFNEPFDSLLFDVDFIPFPEGDGTNSIRAMEQKIGEDVAAFIFEPLVQGAGGMRMYAPDTLESLIKLARTKNIIVIADEVMTGFGRTGKIFATDHLPSQRPDIYCLSKGITGGFLPMGVTTVADFIVQAFPGDDLGKTFFHGHSYTANPLACAAANASMKILLSEEVQESIIRITNAHRQFAQSLPQHPLFSVRQTGTILAIEIKQNDAGYTSNLKEKIYRFFLDRNILLRPLGNVVYLLPPYVVTDEQLEQVYQAIREFLQELTSP